MCKQYVDNNYKILNYMYRGDQFRVAFASLGELRSIIPSNVNIVALTATATRATLEAVTERLALRNPEIVGSSPNRPNIFLTVSDYIPLPTLVEKVCINLKREAKHYSKTVIFAIHIRTAQICILQYQIILGSTTLTLLAIQICPSTD